ncbi:hypothetical protein [Nonomuraea sp. NEAU-A123]|uniref:hypothetical protein n=1 Tax=Nonomuraea sp. NEAU-A123 TaxID=2839649 RepID=UPI001BE4BE6C|nr:hypothetical protein [Nonomuraea sp. NEAU-A123]MBT2234777.1 hypothetical protein [Nonomuraea sp. NEAU-A123]
MIPDQEQRPFTGLEIAMRWAELPPEHLSAALKALNPQLAREHEYRMAELTAEAQEKKDLRNHRLQMTGLITGLVLAVGMLVGAVVLGVNDQPWLAGAFMGPSLLVLVKIFVLRETIAVDIQAVQKAHANAQPTTVPPAAEPGAPPLV